MKNPFTLLAIVAVAYLIFRPKSGLLFGEAGEGHGGIGGGGW